LVDIFAVLVVFMCVLNVQLNQAPMKRNYFTLIILSFLLQSAYSQDCDCDFIIELDQVSFDGDYYGVEPGDVICLQSGERSGVKMGNLHGNPAHPIVIQNCDGLVSIDGFEMGFGLNIESSTYFQLTGSGNSDIESGIVISGSPVYGINILGKSSNFQIDHIQISNTAGFALKAYAEPECGLHTNLGYFTMENVELHDLNISNCSKGMIIGHPKHNSFVFNPYCGALFPHNVDNVSIEQCNITGISEQAIILNGATGSLIENTLSDIGHTGVLSKNSESLILKKNVISQTGMIGFESIGSGAYVFENNVFSKNGGEEYDAIKIDFFLALGSEDVNKLSFINNTVVNSGKSNLSINHPENASELCYIQNNIFAGPNVVLGASSLDIEPSDEFLMVSNIIENAPEDLYFKNLDIQNYELTHTSPALNAGIEVDLETDIANQFRNLAGAIDIGAYEYVPEPLAYFKELSLVGLYVDGFKFILGDEEAENELLNFALENGFNYLLLYNLSYIHSHTYDLTDPDEASVLANFIYKAKTEFGIAQVGAVGEKNASFDKIQVYNSFYEDWYRKIDVLNLEFEFWANTDGVAFTYYCENYLTPGGYDCTNEDAFDFYAIELEAIDNRAHEMGIISEIYLGTPSEDEMIQLCEISDRILIHYYKTSDTYGDGRSIYNYHPDRFRAMALSERKPAMMPIFSSRSYHMGPWLLENSLHQAMDTWLNGDEGFLEDLTPGVSELRIAGFQWYRYTSFLDLIPEFIFEGVEKREGEMKRNKTNSYSVYPTVIQTEINLVDLNESGENAKYCTIRDSRGTLVFESYFVGATNNFNLEHLSRGCYYLNVIENDELVYAQKLIK
jgi:hypothetical protein